MAPGGFVADRDHIGVAGKGDMRRGVAEAGIEVVDVLGAGFAESHPVQLEAGGLQQVFKNTQRAGIGGGNGRAAHEVARNRNSIIHSPA